MSDPLVRRAYAKLNLMLSVGPPEPEGSAKAGYHPIATWMAPIDLWDDVVFTRQEESAHSVVWSPDAVRPSAIDWPLEKDLAVRAHRRLEQRAGTSLPVKIEVRKRIPVGSGLGGGSSDAAAVLLGLNDMFGLRLSEEELTEEAMALGSDVAFFADHKAKGGKPPRPAIVTGFGETIERVPHCRGTVVLVIPPYGCPTGAVYKAFDGVIAERDRARRLDWETTEIRRAALEQPKGRAPEPHRVRPELVRSRRERVGERLDDEHLFNDLAAAAYLVEPRLGTLVPSLSRLTRSTAHVTGSGSCVFVVTSRPEKTLEQVRRGLNEGEQAMIVALS